MKPTKPFLLCLLLFSLAVGAQPYYFRHYQVENGLSHNTIFCSTQDKAGFLWFGTKDGLNRYDGYRFKRFTITSKPGLTTDLVLSLATDGKGVIYVGTQKGLFYFDAERETFIPFLDTVSGINDIYFDSKGQLWFIADYTVNSYNFSTKKWKRFPPEKYFKATALCETPGGTMWFATLDGHLQQYNAAANSFTSFSVFSHSPPAESKVIQKITYDGKGSILIGTNNQGIKAFNLDKKVYRDVLTYNPDRTTIYVRDILQVNEDETWFATESGLFIWDRVSGKIQNLKKKTLDPYSLSDNAIYTLYKDTDGGIWAGTFFGGLNYFAKQHATFQKFFPDHTRKSVSGNAVREICEDGFGNIWIGTEDAGLNKLDPKTGAITYFEPDGKPGSISYYNIHGLLVVGDALWVGTFEHGLDIVDIRTGRVKKHYSADAGGHGLMNNFIVSLQQTRKGDIYVGTGQGLYQFDPKNEKFRYRADLADGSFISCMLEDRNGTLWVGTHNRGLFYRNPSTGEKGVFQHQTGNENSLSNNTLNAIYEDSKGNLWLSTEGGGLCRLDAGRKNFTRYNTLDGLPSNFVFKVLEDDRNKLWVTTSKGLANLDATSTKIAVYTKSDGLLNDQFNYNSGFKDAEGNLYFGSVQGMIKFNPASFQKKPGTPPVHITGFQVQNREIERSKDSAILAKSILYTSNITLPYNQSSFSIDFAAVSFASPEATEYSYIMKGLDKDWTNLKSNRKVYFTNLKPGTYTFLVKAGNNGLWDNEATSLQVVITPPFWDTGWAYFLYIAFASILAYYLVRSYHQVQENKKQKEIYQAKIEFFTTIAHEIKTPLTLIKGPVENLAEMVNSNPAIKDDVVTMERNTNRLVQLVNQFMDFRQTETNAFRLELAEVNISELLREAYELFKPLAKKRHMLYTLELPSYPVIIMADAEALTKVFHNLFSNAVKYGQREVKVRLSIPAMRSGKLQILISNDGFLIPEAMREKIFEPFFRIKETNKQKGTGLGLALAKSLVELHNGNISVKETALHCNLFIVELPLPNLSIKRKNKSETKNPIT